MSGFPINLFSMSVCFCFLYNYLYHILDSIYMWYHMIFVFDLFNFMIIPRSICVAYKWNYFTLFYCWVGFHHGYVPHPFYLSSLYGLLGCFHVLAIVNNTTVNIVVHISVQIRFLQIYAQEWDCWIIYLLPIFNQITYLFTVEVKR